MPYPYNYQPNYQNYFPVGYQPMYQQGYQQPTQQAQMPQQNVQPSMQISNVWIYDESEIANYPIAPNNAVRFWIANKQVFYEKSADATGKPTLKVYDYTERIVKPSDGGNSEDGKSPAFATRDELGAVVGAIKDYSESLSKINSEIETMKSDLYGVAGRKRIVKKQEVEADE